MDTGKLTLWSLTFLIFSASATAQVAQRPETYNWKKFQDVIAVAEGEGTDKKILVDIFSPHCTWCARMYREVYSDSLVNAYASENFSMTQLNLDDFETAASYKGHDLTVGELAYGLGATGTPTTVFLDSGGNYITRLEGFHPVQDFLNVLRFISTEAYITQSFTEFLNAASSQ